VRETHKHTHPPLDSVPGDREHAVRCLLASDTRRRLWRELQGGKDPDQARADAGLDAEEVAPS
jgi:hypothetical protein